MGGCEGGRESNIIELASDSVDLFFTNPLDHGEWSLPLKYTYCYDMVQKNDEGRIV